ncbi:YgcG family protein, partial [Escherichia coli]|nr:YgcG family protein [Escherichia coli]
MRLIFILFTLWCLPGLAQQIAVLELRQQVTDITGTL